MFSHTLEKENGGGRDRTGHMCVCGEREREREKENKEDQCRSRKKETRAKNIYVAAKETNT